MIRSPRWLVLLVAPLVAGSTALERRDIAITPVSAKVLPTDARQHDSFGRSLAMSGETVLVGAKGDDAAGNNAGTAYVFQRIAGRWVEQARLRAGDAEPNDAFGYAVALSGDTALVGASQEDSRGNGAGAAYVFTRRGTVWTQDAKLTARDGSSFDAFGYAVAIDADTAVIGAREDDVAGDDTGSAYVYERRGGAWVERAKLVAPDASASARFGGTVAIAGDVVVVGAAGDDGAATDAGAAYVFRHSEDAWMPDGKLTADDAMPADTLGYAIAVDGDLVAVSALRDDSAGPDAGAVHLYARGTERWRPVAELTPPDAIANQWFGWSLALSAGTIVVGSAYDTHGSDKEGPFGSAYVFVKEKGSWREETKLVARVPNPFDLFGWAVAMSGPIVAISARLDDEAGQEAGAVYLHGVGESPTRE